MRKTATKAARSAVIAPATEKKAPPTLDSVLAPNLRTFTLEDVRLRAYRKWEAAGRPDGDGTKFWLEAERELLPNESAAWNWSLDR
jgi:hypothetical protein